MTVRSLGVEWVMFKREKGTIGFYRKPFASTTKASADLIRLLSETADTIQDIYDNIRFDDEAKTVVHAYVDKGFGDYPAKLLGNGSLTPEELKDIYVSTQI